MARGPRLVPAKLPPLADKRTVVENKKQPRQSRTSQSGNGASSTSSTVTANSHSGSAIPLPSGYRASFSEEDLQIDLDEFVVPAMDNHGHSVREWFRMSPAMERAVEIAISSKQFPYKTRSDLYRHAVYRHLGYLHRNAPKMPKTFMSTMMVLTELLQEEQYKSECESFFSLAADQIEKKISSGYWESARSLIRKLLDRIQDIDDSCSWKPRMLERLDRQFSRYLVEKPSLVHISTAKKREYLNYREIQEPEIPTVDIEDSSCSDQDEEES